MDPESLLRTLQVALGIGLVIFVHEAGHFLAARWCGVRVDVFSLGFGPALLQFRRGATVYQLAMVPFGGYVRMAGEGAAPGTAPAHDELGAKSVGARFLVYSGGVIMNVVFALVAFPIAYSFGVPITRPIIAAPVAGGGAWTAGIPAGSELTAVGDAPIRDFEDLVGAVALNGRRPVNVTFRTPAGVERQVEVQPTKDEALGFYRIGVRIGSAPDGRLVVPSGSPAAESGLEDGARLLGVAGVPQELTVVEQLGWGLESEQPLELRVEGLDGNERTVLLEPSWETVPDRVLFGIGPSGRVITQVRPGGVAQSMGLMAGDRLLSLDGQPLVAGLRDLRSSLLRAPREAELLIEREGEPLSLALPTDPLRRTALATDLAVPTDLDSAMVWVDPRGAAGIAGVPSGVRIQRLGGVPVESWSEIQAICARAVEAKAPLELMGIALGASTASSWTLTPAPASARTLGFDLAPPTGTFRTEGLGASLLEGARASGRFLVHTGLTLKRMATQEVSTRNLGGIITISRVSYRVSSLGWTKLLFFLCILSVNLAFLNVLPIPVLDGGHMLFLAYEGLFRRPVSERAQIVLTYAGLIFILGLMLFVISLDIGRFAGM